MKPFLPSKSNRRFASDLDGCGLITNLTGMAAPETTDQS